MIVMSDDLRHAVSLDNLRYFGYEEPLHREEILLVLYNDGTRFSIYGLSARSLRDKLARAISKLYPEENNHD